MIKRSEIFGTWRKIYEKNILIILIIILILTISIISIYNIFYKELYIHSEQIGPIASNYSYTIYSNATIKYNYGGNKEKSKITNEELKKLIELSNKVEDKYHKKKNEFILYDAGTSTKAIYNKKMNKLITLEMKSSTYSGYNSSDVTKELLDFLDNLEDKYFH